jgi:hypothetical protein
MSFLSPVVSWSDFLHLGAGVDEPVDEFGGGVVVGVVGVLDFVDGEDEADGDVADAVLAVVAAYLVDVCGNVREDRVLFCDDFGENLFDFVGVADVHEILANSWVIA